MLHTRGSKFISKFLKRGMIVGTVERYQLPHKLLSAAIIYVVRRLLNVEACRSQSIEMADDKVPKDVRKLGFEMCRDSIGGAWSELNEEQFDITHLRYDIFTSYHIFPLGWAPYMCLTLWRDACKRSLLRQTNRDLTAITNHAPRIAHALEPYVIIELYTNL